MRSYRCTPADPTAPWSGLRAGSLALRSWMRRPEKWRTRPSPWLGTTSGTGTAPSTLGWSSPAHTSSKPAARSSTYHLLPRSPAASLSPASGNPRCLHGTPALPPLPTRLPKPTFTYLQPGGGQRQDGSCHPKSLSGAWPGAGPRWCRTDESPGRRSGDTSNGVVPLGRICLFGVAGHSLISEA